MERSIAGYGGGATSSSAASGGDSCWRRDVDENLRRLHSLKFGADRALEAGDHASASILGLRLLGFLDSHDSDGRDRASVDRIRLDAAAGVSSARRSLAPDSDRRAFLQARRDEGLVFVKRGDIDLEKIKQSKYFKSVIESSKRNNVDKLIPELSTNGASVALRGSETCNAHQLPKEGELESQNGRPGVWTSKNMKQAKLTSMYGSNVLKPSNTSYRKLLKSENQEPEECVIVEKGHASSQRYARGGSSSVPLQVDEENIHGNDLRRKRRQMEAISPGCENVGSQTGSEEDNADASGNGFVTARAKLGTGKTMIGKAIAGEAKATFFYISASSLTSKWIGEGEKLVRALFGVASCRQPAVIFVDEIDSLLSQRKSEGEHESSRRLKTQFLIEMEGFDSGNEQILLIGATNRPQELDEAARRRLTKRLYIPLPSSEARAWIIRNLLEKDGLFKLSEEDMVSACKLTEGYSGSDMKNLVKDASMGPLREALRQGVEITKLKKEDMRPVTIQDFQDALQEVRPSVSPNELGTYEEWNNLFGSLSL
ncbi:Katanin p60 ATPase-containing subunit A1 [Acorus calamus]|uniref:Katanin p60 ATPase-containing subunit A1 n=1 Tax=Acorus calamus TaxID=4465 RepID=A0AAV9E2T3_ACOCL|nr:Katanin p60 ATPase-containing subunit A1 [Acorus calamus]